MTERPTFLVRRARLADVRPAAQLMADVAAEGRWIGREQLDVAEREQDLRDAIASDVEGVFVALPAGGGRLIGQLGIVLRPYGVAELGMLVAADWRGRGVGTALMGSALDWAREAGAHKIALQVWPHNEAALALYRKFGFEEEGRLRRHYRRRNGELWDAVVMGRWLDLPPPPPAVP